MVDALIVEPATTSARQWGRRGCLRGPSSARDLWGGQGSAVWLRREKKVESSFTCVVGGGSNVHVHPFVGKRVACTDLLLQGTNRQGCTLTGARVYARA